MKVLSVASEIYPLLKTGGLADVVGALPAALQQYGIEVRTLIPGYPAVKSALLDHRVVHETGDMFGGPARILAGHAQDLSVFVLDAPHLFDRPGNPYLGPDGKDWADNAQRFAALCLAAADIGRGTVEEFEPALVHAHDWQAGLVPAYLHYGGGPPSVFTVHNLAFQGYFPAAIFPALRLPHYSFAVDGVEYFGGVGYLKAGLQFASAITTVSPSYAREICTPENGMELDGLLRARHSVLHGIVNGIDTSVWDPANDPHIAQSFDVKELRNRKANKRAIEEKFGLRPDDGLLYCVISRLTLQKGMDLLAASAGSLLQSGARLAVLGAGDSEIEQSIAAMAVQHPGSVGFFAGYNEPLAHLLQAGSDAILIPSRFEPCGLTQLCALRYGCVPVVARVGGLADTIVDANDAALSAGVASGVQFAPVAMEGFNAALARTAQLYRQGDTWRTLQHNGMKADVSWKRSAARYAELYKSLAGT